jgi:ribosomal protein S27AE
VAGDRDDDFDDGFDGDEFDEGDEFDDEPLDDHETALVRQDLTDLADFETAFRTEGYRGVAVWCHDCVEEHYFPWDMLRENLQLLLETGETPVHEPAFQPEPDRYIPWDYARGYVDALKDVGVEARLVLDTCPRCGVALPEDLGRANFCPRCGTTLLAARMDAALADRGWDEAAIAELRREIGIPTRPGAGGLGDEDAAPPPPGEAGTS